MYINTKVHELLHSFTNYALFGSWRDDTASSQMLFNQPLMQTEKITESARDAGFLLELWKIGHSLYLEDHVSAHAVTLPLDVGDLHVQILVIRTARRLTWNTKLWLLLVYLK